MNNILGIIKIIFILLNPILLIACCIAALINHKKKTPKTKKILCFLAIIFAITLTISSIFQLTLVF